MMAATTHKQHVNNISLFLGYCHWYQGVAQPDLTTYLHPLLICDFISLKIAQKHSPGTINGVLDTAVMVVRWLSGEPNADVQSLGQAITWLHTLNTQVQLVALSQGFVNSNLHTHCTCCSSIEVALQVTKSLFRVKPSISELAAKGKWMTPGDLLEVITGARQDVLDEILDDGINPHTARLLHDVTLACTIFGYLPPTRLACLSSLLHPSYDGPCLYPDCKRPGCLGNRLLVLSEDPLKLVMSLPHHKNHSAWEAAIEFELPLELAELVHMWVTQGHDELCQDTCLYGSPNSTHSVHDTHRQSHQLQLHAIFLAHMAGEEWRGRQDATIHV